ncbi:MAG TPA: glucosamine-6-phosphate deaminase [Thermoanaerobaculia bacterium]
MIWEQLTDYNALSARAAKLLLGEIRQNPQLVLGLPTGRTPAGMYQRVVKECVSQDDVIPSGEDREESGRRAAPRHHHPDSSRSSALGMTEHHCFREVTTFNLDEYVGIPREHEGSYSTYMKRNLFDHVDIDPSRMHIPNGNARDLDMECRHYEQEIEDLGGIDLMFLGLGRNGHIGFNEPGTPFRSRTRVVDLSESTRTANASYFPDGHVPSQAITMGIATILSSKRIVLLAAGNGKQDAIARLRSRAITVDFPASALWTHANVHVLVA